MWGPFMKSSSVPLRRLMYALAASSTAYGFAVAANPESKQSGSNVRPPNFSLLGSSNVAHCEATVPVEVQNFIKMPLPEQGAEPGDALDGHAIFGVLLGDGMIESYEVYKRPEGSDEENVIVAYLRIGDKINGHPGVVHGGILSLIFDDALGMGFYALGVKKAFTANLNVDYRQPLLSETPIRVVAQLHHREGRKLFWKAQMTSLDGQTLYAEASSLYIIPRSHA